MRTIISIIILYKIIWADFFMIGGYDCYRLHQGDSCYLNTTRIDWNSDTTVLNDLFDTATTLGMKIMLIWARKPGTSNHNITRFAGGQYSIYEAEAPYFSHELGHKMGEAWLACTTRTGWFQQGPWTNEQYQRWANSLWYNVYFRLKINDNSEINSICTLFVRKVSNNDTIIKAKRALTGQDFSGEGVYDEFLVTFKMDKYETGKIDYAIWYMGTDDSLYCDKIEVRDAVADSLKNHHFDRAISDIANYYNQKSAMFRYYMWDEPSLDQFWASGEVNRLLKTENEDKGGIQAMCQYKQFSNFLNSVNTDELFVDYYPFYGKRCRWGDRIPVDSGRLFQEKLEYMCNNILSKARNAVKSHSDKKFLFIPQAFGHAITDSTHYWKQVWNDGIPLDDEGWWREPSSREIRCMVWLALACGAKGICYFLYQSRKEDYVLPDYKYKDYHWIVGLTSPEVANNSKRALWHTVQSINQELCSLGDLLLTLESDTIFKSARIPITNCFITNVSDSLMQIGTFHDDTSNYFMVVNRHCLPTDTIDITIGIKNIRFTPTNLYDCLTEEKITASESEDNVEAFVIRLLPGQGRLFKLIPGF